MKGKTVLITGGTGGIGKSTALGLAKLGAQVVIVARDKARGDSAVREIKELTGNQDVHVLLADLASSDSIKQLAVNYEKEFNKLDVLINNAGGLFPQRQLTPEGYEYTFAFNHLAYFLLTNLLLDQLKKSPEGRIINVSSEAQASGNMDLKDLHQERRKYSAFFAYCQSKLANVIFTKELARRLKGTTVTVNALHPGVVKTNFGKESGMVRFITRWLGFLFITPEKGAETSIFLASSPEVKGISGEYFSQKKIKKPHRLSGDLELAQKLWEVSGVMTGIKI